MKRWIPFPLLSLLLVAMWLVLNGSVAPGHVILGALVAWAALFGLARLEDARTTLRKPRAALVLFAAVIADVVRSNVAVARIVLAAPRDRTSGFVSIPLDLRNPAGLAALACIITATPGTAWAGYDSRSNVVTIHVLDFVDEATWIRTIKDRYEQPLMEIFE